MLFSFSIRMIQCNDLIKLKLNNIEIPFVETVKYLGVIIDNKLKFESSVFRRLENSYMKSLNKLLNIKLYSTLSTTKRTINMELSISEQLVILEKYKLLPLRLRAFYHYIYFLYSNINNNPTSALIAFILKHKKLKCSNRFGIFRLPLFKTEIGKFSFSTLSIKLINLFLHKHIFLDKNKFLNIFKCSSYLVLFFNLFLKSMSSWST